MITLAFMVVLNSLPIEYGSKSCVDDNVEVIEPYMTVVNYLHETPILFTESSLRVRGLTSPSCQRINAKVQVTFDIDESGVILNYKTLNSTPKRIADREVRRAIKRATLNKKVYGLKDNILEVHYLQFRSKPTSQ